MNDDLIRRQAANDAFEGELYSLSLFEKIQNLPSVQPETHEERTETHACDLIDREAAIDAIYHHLPSVSRTRARTMLHEVPSAQTDVPDINDGDIISRQAAIDALKNERSDWNCDYNVPVDHCIDAIYSVPSVQPEIIRCKDCKWCEDADGLMCKNTASWVVATDYDFGCVLAERRQDG